MNEISLGGELFLVAIALIIGCLAMFWLILPFIIVAKFNELIREVKRAGHRDPPVIWKE
jgi:Zn-dependent protease with chaperone function